MKGHNRLFTRSGILPVGVVVLVGAHIVLFNRLRHAGVSLAVLLGLLLLAIAKHVGVLGSVYAFCRRRSRH